MISAVERGRHLPGLEVLLTISQVLHVAPTEILERLELAQTELPELGSFSPDELDRQAAERFWAGDYRGAVARYDALARRLAEQPVDDPREQTLRVVRTEIRRATALRRYGAMTAARAAVERAIALGDGNARLQAEAYVVLVAILAKAGCQPLARDAADRAVALATESGEPAVIGWAWIERGVALSASGRIEEALRAFVEARGWVRRAGDRAHEINVEGNLGDCFARLGRLRYAKTRFLRAIVLARRRRIPASEAIWLVELGRVALRCDELDEADGCAVAALRIAKPAEQRLTCFRAEWLRHLVCRRRRPGDPDRHRVAYLKKLFVRLEEHRGIDEIAEFKRMHCGPQTRGD
jgi:tetratricopeptide (TPR) repeat protein